MMRNISSTVIVLVRRGRRFVLIYSLGTLNAFQTFMVHRGASGTGRFIVWCNDFERKTRLGFGMFWVQLMMVGGEDEGNGCADTRGSVHAFERFIYIRSFFVRILRL